MVINKKSFLFLCFIFISCTLFAQTKKANNKTKLSQKDNLNKTDNRNEKQGLWYIKKDASHGEDSYTEFGNFVDNRKQGIWYKLDDLGQLKAIETYREGQLNGNAQYYQNGKLTTIGNYRSLEQSNQFDSIWTTDPVSGYDTLIVIPSEYGYVKHGLWRHYDPITGQLLSEELYQVDNLIHKTEYHSTSKNDSIYISKKIEALPHNQAPKRKKSERKSSKSALYPESHWSR